jgi:hypothetical protein
MALVLWARDKLASDAGIDDRDADGSSGLVPARNVRSRAEVVRCWLMPRVPGPR